MDKPQIQLFIENLVLTALTVLKILLLSKIFTKKVRPIADQKHSLVILGNGPSLKQTINDNASFLDKKDVLAVNFFWKSEYYETVKPTIYLINSTNYWAKNKIDQNDAGRKETFKKIAEKTQWPMTLYVPTYAKNRKSWRKEIDQNKNISVRYLNITPIEGFKWFSHFCFRHNLGMPRPHNVLIPSIKIGIEQKFKDIFLIGADHSWLKEIYVAENNKVYLTQKHFYDEKTAQPEEMYQGRSNKTRTLHQLLMKFVYSFQSYFILKDYAIANKSTIYNATPESYIDAFPRYKIADKHDTKST